MAFRRDFFLMVPIDAGWTLSEPPLHDLGYVLPDALLDSLAYGEVPTDAVFEDFSRDFCLDLLLHGNGREHGFDVELEFGKLFFLLGELDRGFRFWDGGDSRAGLRWQLRRLLFFHVVAVGGEG